MRVSPKMGFSISFLVILSLYLASSVVSITPNCRILYDKFNKASSYSRNYLSGFQHKWPEGVIPYKVEEGMTAEETAIIKQAMKNIEEVSCVRWVPYTDQKNYVYITYTYGGCYANLGYDSRRDYHVLNLQRGSCIHTYIANHEMLHVLGQNHEQNRPDRDCHVEIVWENILDHAKHNYYKGLDPQNKTYCHTFNSVCGECKSEYVMETYGLDYDPQSLMHYEEYSWSKNGKKTILSKDGVKIGHERKMTDLDVKKINKAYENCNQITTSPAPCIDKEENCQYWTEHCGLGYIADMCRISCKQCQVPSNNEEREILD